MGERLAEKEQLENGEAIYVFNLQCTDHNSFHARVKVFDNKKVILNRENMQIHIFEKPAWWEVNILWENSEIKEKEYKEMGLYGYYSSSYCKMQCIGSSLIIKSENDIQIEITI